MKELAQRYSYDVLSQAKYTFNEYIFHVVRVASYEVETKKFYSIPLFKFQFSIIFRFLLMFNIFFWQYIR